VHAFGAPEREVGDGRSASAGQAPRVRIARRAAHPARLPRSSRGPQPIGAGRPRIDAPRAGRRPRPAAPARRHAPGSMRPLSRRRPHDPDSTAHDVGALLELAALRLRDGISRRARVRHREQSGPVGSAAAHARPTRQRVGHWCDHRSRGRRRRSRGSAAALGEIAAARFTVRPARSCARQSCGTHPSSSSARYRAGSRRTCRRRSCEAAGKVVSIDDGNAVGVLGQRAQAQTRSDTRSSDCVSWVSFDRRAGLI
jgi:hypothetical protein